MTNKVTLLAAMAFVGSMGVAVAESAAVGTQQAPRQPTPPITREAQSAATHGGLISNGTSANSASVGWHYLHATNCKAYYDGSTTWLYVYPQEGGYWYTSNLVFQNVIEPECAQGNWIALYVTDTSGYWTEVWTYSFK